MGAEDTWGKLQKIAKLVILRALAREGGLPYGVDGDARRKF